MYNRILVTGGAGFVGGHLSLALKRRYPTAEIVAFDNLMRRGSELNLPRLEAGGVCFRRGDVRSKDDLLSLPDPGLIVECSAEPSVLAGYGGSPEYLIETNLHGCFHCLELARRAGADFLFLSTSRVYPVAALNSLPYTESETRFDLTAGHAGVGESFSLEGPRSLYGMTKLAAELMIEEYGHAYRIRAIVNRCALIAGPWQMGKTDQGVAALWMAAHYFRKPLRYIGFGGKGKQVRDVLHVDDLSDLVLAQLEAIDRMQGSLFTVGGGRENSVSLREMTDLCRDITGNHVPIEESTEDRPADIRIFVSDNRKVTGATGWRPRRNVRSVFESIYRWVRANEDALRPVLCGEEGN